MSSKRKHTSDIDIESIEFNPSLHPNIKRSRSQQDHNYEYQFNSHSNMSRRGRNPRSSQNGASGRAPSAVSSLNEKAINQMFDEIADNDDTSIATMEGMFTFAEHLNIDPFADVRILVLIHKLGSKEKPGQITRQEFVSGCKKLQVDNMEKFKNLTKILDIGFMEHAEFRDFYKFCFQFNREGTHKTLKKDMVIELIPMLLKDRIPQERLSSFIKFLETTTDNSYGTITLDQFMSFFDFCRQFPDLSAYDEEVSAWPVLIDDYVDYALGMQM